MGVTASHPSVPRAAIAAWSNTGQLADASAASVLPGRPPPPQGGCPLMGGARSPLPSALGSCCRAEPWPHRPDPMLQLGWRAAGSLPWSRASECHACLGTELLPSPPHPRLSTPTPRPPCLFLPPLDPGQPPLSDSFSCHSAPGGGGARGEATRALCQRRVVPCSPPPPPGKGAGRHPL